MISDANFTTACDPELYVAVTRQARQTGRLTDGKKPSTRKHLLPKDGRQARSFRPITGSRCRAAHLGRFEKHKGPAGDQHTGSILVYGAGFHDLGTSPAHMTAEVPRS
jgi:hypothetical protein